MPKPLPSADYLRERLQYDPETGVLTWKRHERMSLKWNTRYAGKQTGYPRDNGYLDVAIDTVLYRAHRLIWKLVFGEEPSEDIDHIDGDRTNNRLSNLRLASRSQNNQNNKAYGSARMKGAHKHHSGRWASKIKVGKQTLWLGLFDTPEEANAAYTAAAGHHFGQYAYHRSRGV